MSGGLFVPNKKYSTKEHAQAKVTNMVRERARYEHGTKAELGKEYEIVEYELIEIVSIPYTSLK